MRSWCGSLRRSAAFLARELADFVSWLGVMHALGHPTLRALQQHPCSCTQLLTVPSLCLHTLQLCDEVVGHAPLDSGLMHPLKIVLKDLNRLSDLTRVYEVSHEQNPKDVSTMEGLFCAYAR